MYGIHFLQHSTLLQKISYLTNVVSFVQVNAHSLFRRIPDEEARSDPAVHLMCHATEESKKVCSRLAGC